MAEQQPTQNPTQAPLPVWVVSGEANAHSDFAEWMVAAFTTEEMAHEFRDLCQCEVDNAHSTGRRGVPRNFKNTYDPQFWYGYTGTRYRVEPLEVFSSIQQTTQP